jgi:hypothetical protein
MLLVGEIETILRVDAPPLHLTMEIRGGVTGPPFSATIILRRWVGLRFGLWAKIAGNAMRMLALMAARPPARQSIFA